MNMPRNWAQIKAEYWATQKAEAKPAGEANPSGGASVPVDLAEESTPMDLASSSPSPQPIKPPSLPQDKDKAMKQAGSGAGSVIGSLFGGPAGAAVGGAVGGMAGNLISSGMHVPSGPGATIESGSIGAGPGFNAKESAISVASSMQELAFKGMRQSAPASGERKKF
jgi:hypothetical protein